LKDTKIRKNQIPVKESGQMENKKKQRKISTQKGEKREMQVFRNRKL